MKRLLLALLLLPSLAWAQIPGTGISINNTPVQGGTTTQCLYITTTHKVGSQACSTGSVTTWAGGTTGLLPATATSGAITVTGVLVGANGGTGVANTGKTITLGGNLTTSGAFGSTFTMTNTTAVTFPTSGTLATVGGNLGVFTGTSLALGGATIGSNALAVTGTTALGGTTATTLALGGATIGSNALAVTGTTLLGTTNVGSGIRSMTGTVSGGFFQNLALRFDDGSLVDILKLRNFDISSTNQGTGFIFEYGTGNASGGTAAAIYSLTTADWSSAGNRSANLTFQTSNAGSPTTTLVLAPTLVTVSPALQAMTIATSSAPAGSSSGTWKLGVLQAGAVVLDTTRSIFVDIGGTVYKLMVAQ